MKVPQQLRVIIEDGVSASYGLAADDALARRVGLGDSVPTLRLYTYRSHCALVGRFQRIENELRLDECSELGIAVNRRPTGGGAILMGADQLGIALTLPGNSDTDVYGRARESMQAFSAGVIAALQSLGISAAFRRKNDVEVGGRKIAGLGLYRAPGGGLLFHASLLEDMDIGLMLRVLKTPLEKISDKHLATVSARITTVRRETARDISIDEVRERAAAAYSDALGASLVHGGYTAEEARAIAEVECGRYLSESWIFDAGGGADSSGSAKRKTPAGLLDVSIALSGRVIKSVYISGDFFADDAAVAALEAELRWHSSESQSVERTVFDFCARRAGEWSGVSPGDLASTILAAVRQAEAAAVISSPEPYGCFVPTGL